MKIPVGNLSGEFGPSWLQRLGIALRNLGVRYEPYAVATDYTFTDNDEVDSLQVDATTANLSITLPSPTGVRRRRVIKTDGGANTVTVVGTINGVPNYILNAQYKYVEVEPTGTAWLIVNAN